MNKLVGLSLFFQKAALILVSLIFTIFFFASGHGFNSSDSQQMLLFVFLILFVATFIFLNLLNKNKAVSNQFSIYWISIISLFLGAVGFVYFLSEMFQVQYGESKPYFIFFLLFIGLANTVFLVFVFLFRRSWFFKNDDTIRILNSGTTKSSRTAQS